MCQVNYYLELENKIGCYINSYFTPAVNCLDRHVKTHPERTALIWEKDEPKQAEKVSYRCSKIT